MKIAEALALGSNALTASPSPEVDSSVLLCHVLNASPTFLRMWPDNALTASQEHHYRELLNHRSEGQPVAYLVGQRGFWTLDLVVNKATLIPRPDTELLVRLALEKLSPSMRVADLGTGSGAIALALAAERNDVLVFATDYSAQALEVASLNAKQNGLNNVFFWRGSWMEAISEQSFDVVVSNPPYIEENDPHLTEGDLRFEPMSALASGLDGLDDIRLIVNQATLGLKQGGWLLVEHGYHQSDQVKTLFSQAGFSQVTAHQDFGGQDRVVIGQLAL
jgi:release factor glutamine methyltransferase